MSRVVSSALLVAILLSGCACASVYDITGSQQDALALCKSLDVYTRSLFGCPAHGQFGKEQCHPDSGVQDYAAYVKSCEAARRLFKFQEKCK